MVRFLFFVSAVVAMSACTREQTEQERQAALQAQHVQEVVAAGGVVDSMFPVAEMLRRFRDSLPAVDTLRSASASLDALVARLAKNVGAADTTDLNAMVMDRAEFAWLFYEDSPMSKPPYEAPPALLWDQMQSTSNTDLRSLLARLSGSTVRVSQLACPAPEIEGKNRLHKQCTVEFSATGKPALRGTLFGTVLERDGRFKLVSFANRI
jgi:hypothetical protein